MERPVPLGAATGPVAAVPVNEIETAGCDFLFQEFSPVAVRGIRTYPGGENALIRRALLKQ
jgi:hypothetical protein